MHRLGDLHRELARRHEDQRRRVRAALPRRSAEALQQRQRERRGLAGAGRRLPDQVAPFEQRRDGLPLDRASAPRSRAPTSPSTSRGSIPSAAKPPPSPPGVSAPIRGSVACAGGRRSRARSPPRQRRDATRRRAERRGARRATTPRRRRARARGRPARRRDRPPTRAAAARR